MRTRRQGERLAAERSVLSQELPQFDFHDFAESVYIDGWHSTSVKGNHYRLWVDLPLYYPHQIPTMRVTYPWILEKFGGGTLNSPRFSHAFHTSGMDESGYVRICHFRDEQWDASKTCISVLFKGMIWLECYDAHLATGKDIDFFVRNPRELFKWIKEGTSLRLSESRWIELLDGIPPLS